MSHSKDLGQVGWGGQLQAVQPFQMALMVQQFQIGMKGGARGTKVVALMDSKGVKPKDT